MKLTGLSLFFFTLLLISCNNQIADTSKLMEGFENPNDSLNPWCYYYWVANNVTKEGIIRDLESMAEAGIGAAFIGNIGTVDQYQGDVPMLSDEWFDLTVHAVKEGQRVGVDIGIFNSPGWSQSGGPWNKTENSMRYLAYSETMGGVWTPPYRLNIKDALKKGENRLEIEVVNLWMNRLIKDRGLPGQERLTWLSLGHDIIGKDKELFPSGLIGPVRLEVLNY